GILVMARRYGSPQRIDPVADAWFRDDDLRRRRIDLDLSTKVGDVYAEVLLRAPELPAPHRIEDLLVGQRAPGGREQRGEDLPLDRREMDLRSVARHAAGDRIHQQAADRDRRGAGCRGGGRLGAPDLRAGARRELEDAERLRDVVVRAGVQQVDFFVL